MPPPISSRPSLHSWAPATSLPPFAGRATPAQRLESGGLGRARLGSLVAALWFGAGFILGSTLLFAFTARAFGRKAFPADLALGFVLATVIFLLFNKLLTLALPMGPFERLF